MDETIVIHKIFRYLRDRRAQLDEVLTAGNISTWDDFKATRARRDEVLTMEQDIQTLLKKDFTDVDGDA